MTAVENTAGAIPAPFAENYPVRMAGIGSQCQLR
jgi:hypothetical protein